jgi:hypothetical protein
MSLNRSCRQIAVGLKLAVSFTAALFVCATGCDRHSPQPEPSPEPTIHQLAARAHTVYQSSRDETLHARDTAIMNGLLQDLRVHPEEGALVIEFTVPPAPIRWALSWSSKAVLLVRLFDKNGRYLTHFKTNEAFCPADDPRRVVPPEAAGLCRVLESFKGIYGFDAIQISEGVNRLAYPVNERDLAFAEMVEVGFILSGDYK